MQCQDSSVREEPTHQDCAGNVWEPCPERACSLAPNAQCVYPLETLEIEEFCMTADDPRVALQQQAAAAAAMAAATATAASSNQLQSISDMLMSSPAASPALYPVQRGSSAEVGRVGSGEYSLNLALSASVTGSPVLSATSSSLLGSAGASGEGGQAAAPPLLSLLGTVSERDSRARRRPSKE